MGLQLCQIMQSQLENLKIQDELLKVEIILMFQKILQIQAQFQEQVKVAKDKGQVLSLSSEFKDCQVLECQKISLDMHQGKRSNLIPKKMNKPAHGYMTLKTQTLRMWRKNMAESMFRLRISINYLRIIVRKTKNKFFMVSMVLLNQGKLWL